jgi:hypothetical protein
MIIGLVIFSYGFFDVEIKGGNSGARIFKPKLTWGVLVRDLTDRLEINNIRGKIYLLQSPLKTVVLTGMGPSLTYQNKFLEAAPVKQLFPFLQVKGIDESDNCHRIKNSSTYFLYSLSKENAVSLINHGYRLMVFSEYAPSILINKYRYSPVEIGIESIPIFGDHAFWK